MELKPEPVLPPTWSFPVRDREVHLTAMSGPDPRDPERKNQLLDWGEMHILRGQELLAAYQLARQGRDVDFPQYREILDIMIRSDIALVLMATGLDPDFVLSLSTPERQEIIARQNKLNGIDSHLEAFQVGQLKASYAQQQA